MKIEKLTENKIRIILNIEDLETNNIDSNSILSDSLESQNLILSILNKAEKELGFYTKDCKIFIEAFGFPDGIFVFNITKSIVPVSIDLNKSTLPSFSRKRPNAKRKSLKFNTQTAIYSFLSFDEFCDFCKLLNNELLEHREFKNFFSNSSLYFYKDTYYLVFTQINFSIERLNSFFSIISEFANIVNNSHNLESKLIEHGKCIFKRNAILKTIDIFFHHDDSNHT